MLTANPFTSRSRILTIQGILYILLLAASLAQVAWYYPQLPERMASHFNVAGEANAFLPKVTTLKLYLFIIALISVVCLGVPVLVGRLPTGMINLPNKEYWLAPERRQRTVAMLQDFLVGFGNGMLLFFLVLLHEVFRASLMPVPRLSHSIWVWLVLLVAWNIIWTVRLIRAFRLPDGPGGL
jgi:uncharacterized membrane protein